jgi:hypothetical protein
MKLIKNKQPQRNVATCTNKDYAETLFKCLLEWSMRAGVIHVAEWPMGDGVVHGLWSGSWVMEWFKGNGVVHG